MIHKTWLLLRYIVFLGILYGCRYKSEQYRKLQDIDTILQHGKSNIAWEQLSRIDTTTLTTKEDKAYYALLQMQTGYILYMPLPNEAIKKLNSCIDVFQGKDQEKLARCFLYKGNILYEKGLIKDAIWNLKECEELAERQKNPILLDKLYRSMITINNQGNNFSTALIYGRKLLKLSQLSSNKERLATAYNLIAVAFHGIKQDDSARYYINKCIPLLKNVSRQGQVVILDNIGYLNMNRDQQFALEYLRKAAQINPSADTYDNMAQIFAAQGHEQKADSLWKLAIRKSYTEQKCQIVKNIIKHKKLTGQQDETNRLNSLLLAIKDSLAELQQVNKVEVLQNDYKQHMAMKRNATNITWLKYAIFVIVVLSIVCLGYWIRKKRILNVLHNLLLQKLNIKENIINKLETSNNNKDMIINEQKKLITTLTKAKQDKTAYGYKLYTNLKNGGSTIKWSKDDFSFFLDYYSSTHTEFMADMAMTYTNITTREKFYLCLINEGLDKSQIADIMGVAESSLRNFRYKINKKKQGIYGTYDA